MQFSNRQNHRHMLTVTVAIVAVLAAIPMPLQAGGKTPPPPPKKSPGMYYTIGKICRDLPLPTPRRYLGFGAKLNPFYTPTYTYPAENNYAGDNPRYYPFFLPRKFANYKSAPVYKKGDYGYASRSNHYWDSYDEWVLEKSEQRQ